MPGNKYSDIAFRKVFAQADLDSALSSSGGPMTKAIVVERRNIKVLQELVYRFESTRLQLGKSIPIKNSQLRRLFAKSHKLIGYTRVMADKFQAKQNQVPVTCQCECLGPTTSSMEQLVDVEDDSDIEIEWEYNIEENGYLM
jgi:hypothetical protein